MAGQSFNFKKIVMTSTSYERGGVEEFMLTFSRYLKGKGIEVHVVLEQTGKIQSLIEDFRINNIACHLATSDSRTGLEEKYGEIYASLKPDMVHINVPSPRDSMPAMKAASDSNVKALVMFHLFPYRFKVDIERQIQYKKFKDNGQRWLTVSRDNMENLKSSYYLIMPEVKYIYPGIDLKRFSIKKSDARDRKDLCGRLGIPEKSFILSTVGGLRRIKGHDTLLTAMPRLVKSFPELHFLWIGTGDQEGALKASLWAQNLSHKVTFAGYRKDIPELLSISDLYVNPTLAEGCPLAILEAMAAGCPIVSTNVNGIAEVMTDSEHGLLFTKGNSEILRERIEWAIRNYSRMLRMAEAAAKKASEFGIEKMLDAIIEMYNDICSPGVAATHNQDCPALKKRYCLLSDPANESSPYVSETRDYTERWMHLFSGTLMHHRAFISGLRYSDYDIVQVPLSESNLESIAYLGNNPDFRKNARLMVSVHLNDAELAALQRKKADVRKALSTADLVFTDREDPSLIEKLSDTLIVPLPCPLDTDMLEDAFAISEPEFVTLIVPPESVAPAFLAEAQGKTRLRIKLLAPFSENREDSRGVSEYEEAFGLFVTDESEYTRYCTHIAESSLIIITAEHSSPLPGLAEAAYLGIPVIGSECVPYLKIFYPHTVADIRNPAQVFMLIDRLNNDEEFLETVRTTARSAGMLFTNRRIKAVILHLLFKHDPPITKPEPEDHSYDAGSVKAGKSAVIEKKICIKNQIIFETRKSGWNFVIDCLKALHDDDGALFAGFMEYTFVLNENAFLKEGFIPFKTKWIGFFHIPVNVPEWATTRWRSDNLIKRDSFKKSLDACAGLFALSECHASYLRKATGKTVESFYHPVVFPEVLFDFERFMENADKKIFSIGWGFRKQSSVYALPLDEKSGYRKIRLKPYSSEGEPLKEQYERLLRIEEEVLEPVFETTYHKNTYTSDYLLDDEYDAALSENIVFLDLFDASANNAVIECIARATPLLVNPLPAIVEYLGKSYPLYFSSLCEAAEKAKDYALVKKAHLYLLGWHVRDKIRMEYFFNAFTKSRIYRML